MSGAALDTPYFGPREDPHQIRLERRVADLCGFEDALFVPTCTVANQIALRLWTRQKNAVVTEERSHLAAVEFASTAALNQVHLITVAGDRGHLSPDQCRVALADTTAKDIGLVWLENTHMACGGTVMPDGWLPQITSGCATAGVRVHVDGSRIWNAAVKCGVEPGMLLRGADSVAVSLNKGLGAPTGSLLAGSREFIAEAVLMRSAFGAGWRPVGAMAAAGLSVLDGYEKRLSADHELAHELSSRLSACLSTCGVQVQEPDTNIVLLLTQGQGQTTLMCDTFARYGVLTLPLAANVIRLVVHARTKGPAVARAEEAAKEFASSSGATATPSSGGTQVRYG